MTMISL